MPRRCPDMSSPHPAPGQRPSVLRPREHGCWRRMVACPARATRRAASARLGPGGPRGVRSSCSGPMVPHWFGHAHLHAADRVFLDCRGAGILVRRPRRTGPVTHDSEAGRGHGVGRKRSPAEMPGYRRGSRNGLRDGGCLETLGGPGPGDGRQPGIIIWLTLTPAGGLSPRNVAAGSAGAAQAAGVHEGAAARHAPALPAVTLSDMEVQGERAHCRRSCAVGKAGGLARDIAQVWGPWASGTAAAAGSSRAANCERN
jgi:hypothetical protein